MQRNYALISSVVFGLVTVLQITRVLEQWPVQIGPIQIPLWFSWIAAIFAASLCIWGFRSARG
ncbi:hypothetical protein [Dyella psychrodurans]|uniref:Uncharacterized protein n=1 Tax=Dyella psychrodurans TaxID=1927960 RepID=A0A370X763_9GAMM|nr:hypothetical protein [Dyella psychrodurans]RDS84110.1 hypothetical protein DWU99_10140 [Dyella psychrodurans]